MFDRIKILYDKYSKQEEKTKKYEEIQKFNLEVQRFSGQVQFVENYLNSKQHLLAVGQNATDINSFNQTLDTLKISKNTVSEISNNYKNFSKEIDSIADFSRSVGHLNPKLRERLEEKSIDNTAEFQHKAKLTGLRVAQIFIFVFSTYFAVTAATGLLNYFGYSSNLVVPRGLFNFIPSNMAKEIDRARKLQEVKFKENKKAAIAKAVSEANAKADIEKKIAITQALENDAKQRATKEKAAKEKAAKEKAAKEKSGTA